MNQVFVVEPLISLGNYPRKQQRIGYLGCHVPHVSSHLSLAESLCAIGTEFILSILAMFTKAMAIVFISNSQILNSWVDNVAYYLFKVGPIMNND